MRQTAYAVLPICALAALFVDVAPARAEIGAMAAINRTVTGERPREDPRKLVIRDKVIQNERLKTNPDSGGQIMFLDQTTLTVTPNSDLLLDKYIYDPEKDDGALSVTLLKGTMRLIGGRITKKSEANVRTPSATIGIRGGIGNITVRDDGSTEYMHIAGISSTITSVTGQKMTITREGGMATISPPPDGPAPFTDQALAENGQIEAGDGGSQPTGGQQAFGEAGGGAGTAPQQQDLAQTPIQDGSEAGDVVETTAAGDGAGGVGTGDPNVTRQAAARRRAAAQRRAAQNQADEQEETESGGSQTAASTTEAQQQAGSSPAPSGQTQQAASTPSGQGGQQTPTQTPQSGGQAPSGQITFLGVATPEMVRNVMSVRAGSSEEQPIPQLVQRIQQGTEEIEQQLSSQPDAISDAPISTTGEREGLQFAPIPINLDDRPIEEFTPNEVAMATEAEAEAQVIAQELNAISYQGNWSATAGLLNGAFSGIENGLAFRMRYSLLDQEGFVTVELPGGVDGANLTTFDGTSIRGDRFIVLGDDAQSLVADSELLTVLGGDADGSALVIGTGDIANGAIFIDYEDAGLSQIQFIDGTIVGVNGQRLSTNEIREAISNLRGSLQAATD